MADDSDPRLDPVFKGGVVVSTDVSTDLTVDTKASIFLGKDCISVTALENKEETYKVIARFGGFDLRRPIRNRRAAPVFPSSPLTCPAKDNASTQCGMCCFKIA